MGRGGGDYGHVVFPISLMHKGHWSWESEGNLEMMDSMAPFRLNDLHVKLRAVILTQSRRASEI